MSPGKPFSSGFRGGTEAVDIGAATTTLQEWSALVQCDAPTALPHLPACSHPLPQEGVGLPTCCDVLCMPCTLLLQHPGLLHAQ